MLIAAFQATHTVAASLIQSIDYAAIAPPLIVAVAAVLLLVGDLALPAGRKGLLGAAAFAALLAALATLPLLRGQSRATFCLTAGVGASPPSCSYATDTLTLVFQALILAGAAIVVLLSAHTLREQRIPIGEYYFLLLSSVAGALLLVAGRDLITLVVALEVLSLPAFALVGLRRYDGAGSEAALKFFLVSVVATAVMLFGVSLVYGVTGSVQLDQIAAELSHAELRQPVTVAAVALTLVGFGFKISAAPFHFWAPDTYQGAPIPVAAYLSVVSKAAGFAGLILVVGLGFRPYLAEWGPLLGALAALTMTVGNVVALRQRHAVRLLAWSSVAQAGYMLAPFGLTARAGGQLGVALSATVTYALMYAVMNLGAFAVVALVARERPANRLADYRSLVRSRPAAALALAFFLLCLAGLPPGLMGLFAKVVVFRALVAGGYGWLAIVMAVNVVIGLFYYLMWTASLFAAADPAASESDGGARELSAAGGSVGGGQKMGGDLAVKSARTPASLIAVVAITVLAAVLLSFAPQLVMGLLSGHGVLPR